MIELTGKVIHGKKFGRILGFPTANLDRRQYVRDKLKIKLGVWAGATEIGKLGNWEIGYNKTDVNKTKSYKAAIVIGPIDKTGLPKIEAHIIGFKGDLYGKKITLKLVKYVRAFKKYKDQETLIKQIKEDIIQIKNA